MTGQLLLGLSILVILHELGHFIAARAFGIKVEKFYLFFDAWGIKLLKFKAGDTEYGIGWLPLGGYVKIAGMIDESMDTEQMAKPIQPWEYRAKPAWQRLIVMLGGIIVNIIVGIFIFWMMIWKNGETLTPNDKLLNGIHPGIIGKQIGLKDGDKLLAINGQRLVYIDEIYSSKVLLGGTKLTVSRDGKAIDYRIPETILDSISKYGINEFVEPRTLVEEIIYVKTPQADKEKTGTPAYYAGFKVNDKIVSANGKEIRFTNDFNDEIKRMTGKKVAVNVIREGKEITLYPVVSKAGTIGVTIKISSLSVVKIEHNLLSAFGIGAVTAWSTFTDNAKGIWKMITGKVSARNISSPIGIAKVYGSEFNWDKFWRLTGFISMALAFMNLLPIPALDGGHVVFLTIEMIKGRPLGDKFMERAQIAGFLILVSLMVFAFGNDLLKLFGK